MHRLLLIAAVALLHLAVLTRPASAEKPNILFILTDDQGWSSLSCYGNRHLTTPHLDRLAAEGMRFTDAYVTPQCTPTRAALLSGQYPARNRMWHVIGWYGYPWARMTEPAFAEQFPRDSFNLAKALRSAGYVTGIAGKWHLTTGPDGDYTSLKPAAADAYGFDFAAPPGPGPINEGDKWVDHLTDQSIRFIREHQGKPWFLYLAHHTVHLKLAAPPELIAKHRARGAPETGMHNALYLASLEHLDSSVGRLLAALDDLDLRQRTLVIFLSDNGGVDTAYMPPADGRMTDTLAVRETQFDNAPLRSGKGTLYEGGVRVPCLVRWPGVIAPGRASDTPIHVTDFMPTLMEAAGVSAPADHTLDGRSLLPHFKGQPLPPRPIVQYAPLYDLAWPATPAASLRLGDWKLIEYFGDSFDIAGRYRAEPRLELYHLGEDLGESRDRAADEPARARAMRQQLREILASFSAPIPTPNPHFDPARAFSNTRQKQPWNR